MRLTVTIEDTKWAPGTVELKFYVRDMEREHNFTEIMDIDMLEAGFDYIFERAQKLLKHSMQDARLKCVHCNNRMAADGGLRCIHCRLR